jgi:hypothetical protein
MGLHSLRHPGTLGSNFTVLSGTTIGMPLPGGGKR